MADGRTRQGSAAVALRLAGASYAEISEVLMFPTARDARHAVESELALAAEDPQSRSILRAEESGRLERLLRGVWPKATDPVNPEHLPAAKVALSIIDRHVRLHGLDAPAEFVVHTPTATEIDKWVARVTATSVDALRELEAVVVQEAVPDDADPLAG